jgi:hypothetical protein
MLSKQRNKFSKLYSVLSRVTFFWIIKLLRKGEKTKLKLNDLNDIDTNLKSETIRKQFVLKNDNTSGLMKALWKLIWIPISIATILELMSVIIGFGLYSRKNFRLFIEETDRRENFPKDLFIRCYIAS